MKDDASKPFETTRRAMLGSVGAAIGGLPLGGSAIATDHESSGADRLQIRVRQDDRCVPATPFTGEQPVEEWYEYTYPRDRFDGPPGKEGTTFSSEGTTALQRDGVSLVLLYDGPNGLSLVIVHGSLDDGPSEGGAVTFEIAGLPDDGTWVVRDDYYVDPDTGERAESNYDTWSLDGTAHEIDWTWGDGRTDGGVFRGLDGDVSVTIDPAFNERAALFGEEYDGTVHSWQFLVPDGDDVQRHDLDMTAPVAIEMGACDGAPEDARVSPGVTAAADVKTVEFKGCGQAWFVFEPSFDGPVEVEVETTAGRQRDEISADDLQRVPGQFGDHLLFKWRSRGEGKILAAETSGGTIETNPHECAQAGTDETNAVSDHEDGGADADDDENRDDRADVEPGPPSGAGPPDHAGPPADAGLADDAGPPSHAGPRAGRGNAAEGGDE